MDEFINELEKLQQFYLRKQSLDIEKYSSDSEEDISLKKHEMIQEFEIQKSSTIKFIELKINKIRFGTSDEKTKYLLVYLNGLKDKILSTSIENVEELSDEIKKYKSVIQSTLKDKDLGQQIDDYNCLLEEDRDLDFITSDEEKNIDDKCRIVYDSKNDTYLIKNIDSKENMSMERQSMPLFKEVIINDKTHTLLIDRDLSQLTSKFDKNNETCFQERYIKLLKLRKNRVQVKNVASKMGINILYDLTYLYNYDKTTGEPLFSPEQRKAILSIANFASKKGFAKVKKGFKVLILEKIDKLINRDSDKIMITDGEKKQIKTSENDQFVDKEFVKNIENALEKNELQNKKNDVRRVITPEEERKQFITKYLESNKRIKDSLRENSKSYVKKTPVENYFDNVKETRKKMAKAQQNSGKVEWKNGNIVVVKNEMQEEKNQNVKLKKYDESNQRIKDKFRKNSAIYVKKTPEATYFENAEATRQKMNQAQQNKSKPQWINGNIVMVKDEEQDERE